MKHQQRSMNCAASLRLCCVNFAYAVRFFAYRYFYCFIFYFLAIDRTRKGDSPHEAVNFKKS